MGGGLAFLLKVKSQICVTKGITIKKKLFTFSLYPGGPLYPFCIPSFLTLRLFHSSVFPPFPSCSFISLLSRKVYNSARSLSLLEQGYGRSKQKFQRRQGFLEILSFLSLSSGARGIKPNAFNGRFHTAVRQAHALPFGGWVYGLQYPNRRTGSE